MQESLGRLTERDLRVLRHVLRYRISTPEALRRLFDLTEDAEIALTRRLIQNRHLGQHTLVRRRKYYHLTPASAQFLGANEKLGQPLPGVQSIVNNYAILAFCCLGPVLRERITRDEFHRDYPQLIVRGVPADQYYWDTDKPGVRRLAFIRVDHGGEAKKIVRRAIRDVQKRATAPAFRELFDRPERGFMMTIVTSNDDKANAIRKLIAATTSVGAFRVEAARGMDFLTTPRLMRSGPVATEDLVENGAQC